MVNSPQTLCSGNMVTQIISSSNTVNIDITRQNAGNVFFITYNILDQDPDGNVVTFMGFFSLKNYTIIYGCLQTFAVEIYL